MKRCGQNSILIILLKIFSVVNNCFEINFYLIKQKHINEIKFCSLVSVIFWDINSHE
jgi:hypothetical protein